MELYLIVSYKSTRSRPLKPLKSVIADMQQAVVRVDNVSLTPTYAIRQSSACGSKHIRSLEDESVRLSLSTNEMIHNYIRYGELELVVVPQSTIRVFHRGVLAGHLCSSVKRSFEESLCSGSEKVPFTNRGVLLHCGIVYLINPSDKIVSFSLAEALRHIQLGRKLEDIKPKPVIPDKKVIDFHVIGQKQAPVIYSLTVKGLVERHGRQLRSLQLPAPPTRQFTCMLHSKDWRKKGKKLLVAAVQPLVKNFDLIFTYFLLDALDMSVMSSVQLATQDMNALVHHIARLDRDCMNLYICMRSREKLDLLFEYRNKLQVSQSNVMVVSGLLSCLCVVRRLERVAWVGSEKGLYKISISNIL